MISITKNCFEILWEQKWQKKFHSFFCTQLVQMKLKYKLFHVCVLCSRECCWLEKFWSWISVTSFFHTYIYISVCFFFSLCLPLFSSFGHSGWTDSVRVLACVMHLMCVLYLVRAHSLCYTLFFFTLSLSVVVVVVCLPSFSTITPAFQCIFSTPLARAREKEREKPKHQLKWMHSIPIHMGIIQCCTMLEWKKKFNIWKVLKSY